MGPSEWRRLAARKTVGWLSRLADHVVEQPPALAGDIRSPLDTAAEAAELANEVFERRFDIPAKAASAIGKEEEAGQTAEGGADQGCGEDLSIGHTFPPPANLCVGYKLCATHHPRNPSKWRMDLLRTAHRASAFETPSPTG
jgi:hypothetical protein